MIPMTKEARLSKLSSIENDMVGPENMRCSARGYRRSGESRAALDDCNITFENTSILLYQNSCRCIRDDDNDSISNYDYSVRASSDLDRHSFRSKLATMGTMDSDDFHAHDSSWIANRNIARYNFENFHSENTDGGDLDEDSIGCKGSSSERDDILGCIKGEVERCKHELKVFDEAKITMLLGTACESPTVNTSKLSSSKQSLEPNKKSMTTWLTGLLHRAAHINSHHANQELQSTSLKDHYIRRSKVSRSVSEKRRASF